MKIGIAVISYLLSFAGFCLNPVFSLSAAGQSPIVSDIPDQTTLEGLSFQAINLDEFVSDDNNSDADITWSYSTPAELGLDIDAGRIVTISTPSENWNGNETIIFTAMDPDSNSSLDAATFTVSPVNDPPVIGDIPDQTVKEGERFDSIKLDEYVTDVDNEKSELDWNITGNDELNPDINPDRLARISIPKGWTGSEQLTFTVNDLLASASDNASFTVKDITAAPIAVNDDYDVAEGETLDVPVPGVLSNDTDADGDDLAAILIDVPDHGSINLSDNGSFSYEHDGSETTIDAFTYQASDGVEQSDPATVTITIDEVNDIPALDNIEGAQLAYDEGDGPVIITHDITVSDVDNDNLASAIIAIDANYHQDQDLLAFANTADITGSWNSDDGIMVLLNPASANDYQIALRSVRYNNTSENPNTADRTITFLVNDGSGNSNTQSRIVAINRINDSPVIGDIPDQAVDEGQQFELIQLDDYVTDVDNEDSELSWIINGNTDLVPDINSSHVASIGIPANWTGSEQLTFAVNDLLASASDNASFTVKDITAAPVAVNDDYDVAEGETLNVPAPGVLSNDTDADGDDLSAIKETDPGHGTLTLNSDGSFTYDHDGSEATSDAFTYRASDGTEQSSPATVTITINPINDAPVLSGIEGAALDYGEGDGPVQITNTITVADDDNANLASATVTISSNYQNGQDVLAFTNANGISGTWNASTGIMSLSGSSSVSNYQAALRSVSYNNTSSDPNTSTRTVTFRVNDGTAASNTQTRNITIGTINNPPVLANIESAALAYNEGDGLVQITGAITVTDNDNANLASATVTISSNYQNGQDVLAFTNANGISGTWNASTGIMTLSGSSSVANYQAALRSVRYSNTSENPSTAIRTVTFRAYDGTDFSNLETRNITVIASNDPPVLANIESAALAYNEGDGLVQITSAITVTDNDNANLASATVTISSNYQNGQDVLAFTNANGISGTWNASTGIMSLSGSSSVSNYQAALRSVSYNNTSSDPNTSTRTVTFRVNDGTAASNTQTRNITIGTTNNPPVLANIESAALAYNEGDGLVQITSAITVTDNDNANLASATVTISSNYQNGQDVLAFTNANGISGTWNASTGIMTLSGSSSVANYQAALRSVRYSNTSENPSTAIRTVTFRAYDGTDFSNLETRNITVIASNDPPVLANIESAALAYNEGDGLVQITGAITVTDNDNANLASATVTISSNYQNGQDVLAFTNANGISGTWNASTGIMTLSGSSSVANYQAALRSVRYSNTSENPSTAIRTVTFRAYDGTDFSNLETRNITVIASNDPPVLANIESTALAYNEGDGLVQITNAITVTDNDNANLASATVTISSNYQNGQDVLAFTNANGISGTWNASTGIMSLSGSSSVSNYQAALRSVSYNNTSSDPNTSTRTVTFRVNDGTAASNTQTRNITIGTINNPPVLDNIESAALAYNEGDGLVQITGAITVTDNDNANLASATVTISSNYQNGQDVLAFTNANGISGTWNASTGIMTLSGSSSVANYQAALRSVRYSNTSENPSTAIRTVTFRAYDGTDFSNLETRNITVIASNDPPVLANIESTALAYAEGDGLKVITGAITVTDDDNANLASATVTISSNYQSDQDTLVFTNISGITGIWNESTGVMTLSGSSSVANYQAALRSVRYGNTSENPSTAVRTITFRVSDGTENSNILNRNITLTVTNDAPVLGGIETASLNYTEGDGAVQVTNTLTVADPDNVNLASATISITSNYRSNQDSLVFTNVSGITGSWNSTTGTLTLTGSAIVSNYQAALRSVRYHNKSSNPNTSTRTVTFRVNDGTVISNAQSRNITVVRVGVFSASIVGTAGYCAGFTMPITLTITDGRSPFTATLRRTNSVSNKDTTLSGISASPYIIQVKLAGTYTLISLTDANLDAAAISGEPVVLSLFPKPSAILTGSQGICNDGVSTAPLSLNLSGTAPWTFRIRRGTSNDTTYTGISADPYTIHARIIGASPTTYRMISISDAHCAGDTIGSGTARVFYINSPAAAISGVDTICPSETGKLSVVFSGTPGPWNITYLRNGADPTVINNISNYSYDLIVPGTGTYTLSRVQDAVCTGRVSGNGLVVQFLVPVATMSGSATICEHTTTNLNVALTGDSPWKYSFRRNAESPVEVVNIMASPNKIPVKLAGTYTLYEVFDKHCKGTVSGSAVISVTPGPDVNMSGLDPAYNKSDQEWKLLTGIPSGGTFSGPGVIPYNNTWYFIPSLPPVGTHNVVYTYQSAPGTCYGYDTTVVRVLQANALIEFPEGRIKYCRNEAPFTITGVNIVNDTGSFSITGDIGLTDNGDNTATIDPSVLGVYEYTITYTYFDGTLLPITSVIEIGNPPVAEFIWETECFAQGQPIKFDNTSYSTFGIISGSSWKVYTNTGYDTATTPDITYTFPEPGNHVIELQVQSSYGCSNTIGKVFGLRPTYPLANQTFQEDFESEPVSWLSGTSTTVTVNSWMHGDPSKGFSGASSGEYCWYTYIPQVSAPREQSWVTSPCFDFMGTNKPMLTMDIWRLFNSNRDGANIQATVDSGKTWILIGQLDDGINWFNNYNIRGNPGGSSVGWSNINDAGWLEARHSLDMLKGKNAVQFRIAYGSDGTAQGNNGIAFDDFWIGERNRTALLEHFTNASDVLSMDADSILNFMVSADSLNIIDIQYHTSFPGPDPFNEQEPYIPGSRVLYYGLSDVPYAILSGGTKTAHRFDFFDLRPLDANLMHIESLLDSKFEILPESWFTGNTLNISTEIVAKESLPARELTVHVVVIERKITGVTGGNGETVFESVVKTMLPDAAGTTLYKAWTNGEKRTIPNTWEMENVYDQDELRVVAFIQDESTHEVYQAAIRVAGFMNDIPDGHTDNESGKFIIFPNPASERVYVVLDEPAVNDVKIEFYNNLGSLVYTGQISKGDRKTEIATGFLPYGLYLVRGIANNQVIGIKKLTIAR